MRNVLKSTVVAASLGAVALIGASPAFAEDSTTVTSVNGEDTGITVLENNLGDEEDASAVLLVPASSRTPVEGDTLTVTVDGEETEVSVVEVTPASRLTPAADVTDSEGTRVEDVPEDSTIATVTPTTPNREEDTGVAEPSAEPSGEPAPAPSTSVDEAPATETDNTDNTGNTGSGEGVVSEKPKEETPAPAPVKETESGKVAVGSVEVEKDTEVIADTDADGVADTKMKASQAAASGYNASLNGGELAKTGASVAGLLGLGGLASSAGVFALRRKKN